MIANLASALLVATAFAGGSPDDFAKAVATATGHSVIVASSASATLKPFSFSFADLDGFADSVRTNTPFRMAAGVEPVFSDGAYVATHFQQIIEDAKPAAAGTNDPPKTMLKDGKVTLTTKGATPLYTLALTKLPWAKPLTIPAITEDLALSISVKDVPEREFLQRVAKAVGGFFTYSDTGYQIDLDTSQTRVRIQAALATAKVKGEKSNVDIKRSFYSEIVGALPDDALSALFTKKAGPTKMDIEPNSALAQAAVHYIEALTALEATQPDGLPKRATGILRRIDSRVKVHLMLGADGTCVLSVPVIQGRKSAYRDL